MFAVGSKLVELGFKLSKVFVARSAPAALEADPGEFLSSVCFGHKGIETLIIDIAVLAYGFDGCRLTNLSDVVGGFLKVRIKSGAMLAKLDQCLFSGAKKGK